MYNKEAIKRREWTTRCADPTVVVEWTIFGTLNSPHGQVNRETFLKITEFQGIYVGEMHYPGGVATHRIPDEVAKIIHFDLETQWEQTEREAHNEEADEVRRAERAAGWYAEPDPRD